MRRRTWVLAGAGVLGLALVGAGTGIGVAAALYQPLHYGGLTADITGAKVTDFDIGGDVPEGVQDIPYRDGEEVVYGFDLANTGGWGVRITSFEPPLDPMFHALLKPFAVRLEPRTGPHNGDQGPMSDAETVPFQPFDLGPGQDRWIVVHARLGDCEFYLNGSPNVISDQDVHFSFFGMDHHASVAFRYVLRIISPPSSDCPRPRVHPDVPTAAPLATPVATPIPH